MTTKIEVMPETNTTSRSLKKLLWVAPLAMLASAAANLGLYAAAGLLFPEVTAWPGAGIGQIIGASCAYLFIGAIVFAGVVRFSAQPARHFMILATVGLVLSLGLPIAAGFGYAAPGAPPAGIATVITLSLMHVIAYAITVPLFTRLALD